MLRIPYEEDCWDRRDRIRMEGGEWGVIRHSPESLPGTTINICMCPLSSRSPFEPIKCCKQYSKDKINIGHIQKWVGDGGGGSVKLSPGLLLAFLPPND